MLHYASQRGNETLVKVLLGAQDVHIWTYDKHGKTPLHYAAESGNVAIINMLAQQGFDIHAKDSADRKAIYYAKIHANAMDAPIELGADPHERDTSGISLLQEAVAWNSVAVV